VSSAGSAAFDLRGLRRMGGMVVPSFSAMAVSPFGRHLALSSI
jgi:hypothetical protein